MLHVDPSHPQLADEALDWAEQAPPGALSVEVAEMEPHLATTLERRGYTRALDGPFMAAIRRPLTHLPGATIHARRLPDPGPAGPHRCRWTCSSTPRRVRLDPGHDRAPCPHEEHVALPP
jgi:hypothetical protein